MFTLISSIIILCATVAMSIWYWLSIREHFSSTAETSQEMKIYVNDLHHKMTELKDMVNINAKISNIEDLIGKIKKKQKELEEAESLDDEEKELEKNLEMGKEADNSDSSATNDDKTKEPTPEVETFIDTYEHYFVL
jgi:C4-type Zn-finger protein